jgi:DNA polymerase (family 10)
MSEPGAKLWPLGEARRYAEHIQRELASLCERIDIAGSIRRGRPEVHDLDLVLLLKPGKRAELEARVKRSANTRVTKNGPQIIGLILHNGMQVELYIATEAEDTLLGRIPTNYGMRLLAMTGSKAHNIKLAQWAKDNGFHFHPYRGLMQGGKYVPAEGGGEEYEGGYVCAGETEQEIFDALGLAFVPPENRETDAYFTPPKNFNPEDAPCSN